MKIVVLENRTTKHLLVGKRRSKEKDGGTEEDKSDHREKGSSEVSGVGGDHLGRLCDTAGGDIGDIVKDRHLGCLNPGESGGAHCEHDKSKEVKGNVRKALSRRYIYLPRSKMT